MSIQLDRVSLKSALNLILHNVHLTYVIQDGGLLITTGNQARTRYGVWERVGHEDFEIDEESPNSSPLYVRPGYSRDDRLFFGLLGFAPG